MLGSEYKQAVADMTVSIHVLSAGTAPTKPTLTHLPNDQNMRMCDKHRLQNFKQNLVPLAFV